MGKCLVCDVRCTMEETYGVIEEISKNPNLKKKNFSFQRQTQAK
jgi:hypothetical protein